MSTTDPASVVLFARVSGADEVLARVGDRSAEIILGSQEELFRDSVRGHGGRRIDSPDGFAAAFVTSRAAVDCAVAIRRGYHVLAEEGLRLRIGLDVGGSEEGADSARVIAAAASTGQVLAAARVRDLAGTMPGVQFLERGPFTLTGTEEPVPLFEVQFSIRRERTRSPLDEGETGPLAAREAELAALRGVLYRALSGKGSVVLVAGEPGTGKTRLAEEAAREAAEHGFLAMIGRCVESDTPAPFGPLLDILRAAAGVVPREVFRETLGDAAAGVARLLPELRDMYLDIDEPDPDADPVEEGRQVLEACLNFLERTSRRRPLALVLDALQWSDASSVKLLERAAERIQDMPAVIIGTYRHAALGSGAFAGSLERLLASDGVEQIVLAPLAGDEAP